MYEKKRFGGISEYEGEFSDYPAVAIGTDDLVNSLTAVPFEVYGFITSNKSIKAKKIEDKYDFRCFAVNDYIEERTGKKYRFPITNKELQEAIVGKDGSTYASFAPKLHEDVKDFFSNLEDEYDKVFVNLYQNSMPETEEFLKEFEGFVPIAPTHESKKQHDKKTDMYNFAKDLGIPVVEGEVASDFREAAEIVDSMVDEWDHGAFVSYEKGAGGNSSMFAKSGRDVRDEFLGVDGEFLVLRRIPLDKLKKNPNDLHLRYEGGTEVFSVTDQIMDGVKHMGNIYPFFENEEERMAVDMIEDYTELLGDTRSKEGYRGFAGNDWMWTDECELYFVESNERKNRSTLQNVLMHEIFKEPDQPSLQYLEAIAVMEKDIEDMLEDRHLPDDYNWAMEIYKTSKDCIVHGEIPNGYQSEIEVFRDNYDHGAHGIFSAPPKDTQIAHMNSISKDDMSLESRNSGGTQDVARIVSVARNREDLEDQREISKRKVEKQLRWV